MTHPSFWTLFCKKEKRTLTTDTLWAGPALTLYEAVATILPPTICIFFCLITTNIELLFWFTHY